MKDFRFFIQWFYLNLGTISFKMDSEDKSAYFDYAPGYYEAALKYKSRSLDFSFAEEAFSEPVQIKNGASTFPFKYNHELEDIVRGFTKGFVSDEQLFEKLHNWVHQNIKYDDEKYEQIKQREKDKTNQRPVIKDSLETFMQRKGICCEQAYLLVTMGRLAKLDTYFTDVETDSFGEKVAHACSALKTKKGYILADSAYKKFNIQHKKFSVWTADKAVRRFRYINDTIYTIKDLIEECNYSPIFVESIKSDEEAKTPGKSKQKPLLKKIVISALLATGLLLYAVSIVKYRRFAEDSEKISQQRMEYIAKK